MLHSCILMLRRLISGRPSLLWSTQRLPKPLLLQSETFYQLSVSQSVSQSINKAHYLIWQWVVPAINEDCWLEALYPTQRWFISQCCYLFSNLNASQLCWWESGKPKFKASLLAYMNGATCAFGARPNIEHTIMNPSTFLAGSIYICYTQSLTTTGV